MGGGDGGRTGGELTCSTAVLSSQRCLRLTRSGAPPQRAGLNAACQTVLVDAGHGGRRVNIQEQQQQQQPGRTGGGWAGGGRGGGLRRHSGN